VSYQVLARRWRPLTFEAVVGQAPIVRTLQNALARERIAHAYLFAGPRGVGKTTTARLLAMGLSCERADAGGHRPCAACDPCREVIAGRALDVIEIDGASNRGIDEVRALRENARYAPARARRKVYIIDEVHMLTEPAFNALLKTLEEPPAHVVFVLATTEPRRLPLTILSRCQRFDFRPIVSAEIAAGLRRILDEEASRSDGAFTVEPDALALIGRAAEGSLRDALSLLDAALAYGEGRVTADAVRELLGSGGAAAAWGLAEALVRREPGVALTAIERAAADGLDLGLLCQEAMEVLRRALLVQVLSGAPPDTSPEEAERLRQLAPGGPEDLLLLVKGLVDAEAEMRRSPHPRVDLEVTVVRLCHRPQPQAIESLLERLERAEAHLRGYGPTAEEPARPEQADLLSSPAPPVPAPSRAPARPVGPTPVPPSRAAVAPLEATPGSAAPGGLAEAWPRIVAEVTRLRPTFGHLLAGAVVIAEGGRLTVSVPNGNAFTQDQVRDRANRQLLLEAVQRVLPEVRDLVFDSGATAGGPGAAVTSHPTVQAVVELFDGEVTAVRPAGLARPGEASPESREVR
jgi:DNA polymerase-3 subunit gamma/tau